MIARTAMIACTGQEDRRLPSGVAGGCKPPLLEPREGGLATAQHKDRPSSP